MSLWYSLVRRYVSLGLSLYFRKIQVVGKENIPPKGPVLFTVNHQNAFLDALLLATSNSRHTHFLVRADVFKSNLVKKFFASLNMMPIYRIRDGRNSLANNEDIFRKCFKILDEQHALLLFPEANHHQKRLLLPLSKGFTRIALGVKSAITIIPVGLNYTHHRRYGGSVSINYGKPISTLAYLDGKPQSNQALRKEVGMQMQRLITCIPNDGYYQIYEDHLNQQPVQYLDPNKCNRWMTDTNPEQLSRIEPPSISSFQHRAIRVISYLFNLPPLALCYGILRKIGDPVFSSSIKFIFGIFIFPLYYLLLVGVTYVLSDALVAVALVIVAFFTMMLRKWFFEY